MSRDNTSTPERGSTWYQGKTIDTANLEGVEQEGTTKVFEDNKWGDQGIKGFRSARFVVCRLFRNMSGVTLLPKRLAKVDPANRTRVTGYCATLAEDAVPIDEYLPATGVPHGDLFWGVMEGPAILLTQFAGAGFDAGDIATGDILVAGTASASTASGTTGVGGRVSNYSVVAAMTTIAQFTAFKNSIFNAIGRAMSAKTTGQTHSDILVDVAARPVGW